MMRLSCNPEVLRHVWRDFSWPRLLAAPALFVFLLIATRQFNGDDWADVFFARCLTLYYLFAVFWGNYAAATALRDDVRGNMWDFQRLSALSPAALGFGKLAGAVSYVWYMSLPFLVAALFGMSSASPSAAAAGAFYLVAAGLCGQVAAFLLALESRVRRAADRRHDLTSAGFVVPFVAGAVFSHTVYTGLAVPVLEGTASAGIFAWYGLPVPMGFFVPAAILFLTALCLAGIWRLAAAQMLYRLTPAVWALCSVLLMLFLGGFVFDSTFLRLDAQMVFGLHRAYYFFFYMLLVLLVTGYYAMLSESKDAQQIRHFVTHLRQGGLRAAGWFMPRWAATAVLALAVYLGAFLWHAFAPAQTGGILNVWMVFSFFTSLILFAVRDGMVMYLLSYGRNSRHLFFERVVYYLAVYVLLPFLHVGVALQGVNFQPAVFLGFSQQTGIFHPWMYLGWYYPTFFAMSWASLVPVLVQIAALGGLWHVRLRYLKQSKEKNDDRL